MVRAPYNTALDKAANIKANTVPHPLEPPNGINKAGTMDSATRITEGGQFANGIESNVSQPMATSSLARPH